MLNCFFVFNMRQNVVSRKLQFRGSITQNKLLINAMLEVIKKALFKIKKLGSYFFLI